MGTRWSFALDKGRFLTSTQGSPEGSWGTFAVKTDGFGTGKSSLPASTCSSLTSRPCTAAYQRRQSTVTGGSCSSGGHGRLMLATARDHRISCKGKRKVTYGVITFFPPKIHAKEISTGFWAWQSPLRAWAVHITKQPVDKVFHG
jgi:hypothetical protein